MNTYNEEGWVDERTYCPSDLMALEVEAEEVKQSKPKIMINQISNLQSQVTTLLTNNEALRDNDAKLISTIWSKQVNVSEISAMEFIIQLSSGNLKSTESITRARRLVQQNNPALRGLKYKSRQITGDVVKENIHTLNA